MTVALVSLPYSEYASPDQGGASSRSPCPGRSIIPQPLPGEGPHEGARAAGSRGRPRRSGTRERGRPWLTIRPFVRYPPCSLTPRPCCPAKRGLATAELPSVRPSAPPHPCSRGPGQSLPPGPEQRGDGNRRAARGRRPVIRRHCRVSGRRRGDRNNAHSEDSRKNLRVNLRKRPISVLTIGEDSISSIRQGRGMWGVGRGGRRTATTIDH